MNRAGGKCCGSSPDAVAEEGFAHRQISEDNNNHIGVLSGDAGTMEFAFFYKDGVLYELYVNNSDHAVTWYWGQDTGRKGSATTNPTDPKNQ